MGGIKHSKECFEYQRIEGHTSESWWNLNIFINMIIILVNKTQASTEEVPSAVRWKIQPPKSTLGSLFFHSKKFQSVSH